MPQCLQLLADVQDTAFGLNPDFTAGLELLRRETPEPAEVRERFAAACAASEGDTYWSKYTSYYGLMAVLTEKKQAIDLCRQAAYREEHDPDVFLALALAERHLGNRMDALAAMRRGLMIAPNHAGLNRLSKVMGVRKRPVIPFLSRSNLLNQCLGRLTRRTVV